MATRLKGMLVAAVLAARSDENVRWYDSEQRIFCTFFRYY